MFRVGLSDLNINIYLNDDSTKPRETVYCLLAAVLLTAAMWGTVPAPVASAEPPALPPRFVPHTIDTIGDRMGQTSLVDLDGDGDLDWVTGCSGGDVWWFEYQSPGRWVRHQIGRDAGTDVGGTMADVDGDGHMDQISGSCWYRNPGKPGEAWTRFENGAIARSHDVVAADMDGDGRLDFVMMSDRSPIVWYKTPSDPTPRWIETVVGPSVHGGIGPRGVGDLDGDGDLDIFRSNGWFENADGRGSQWIWHPNIPGGHDGLYPNTTRSWIADIDGDGDNDVVVAQCDLEGPRATLFWFENADGRGQRWVSHIIARDMRDLHTLAVADFDNDGRLDVFSGEGPLSGRKAGEFRWYIWRQPTDPRAAWTEEIIHIGSECHEGVAADVDGDGDIDICSKPWNGNQHVYLENTLIQR